MQARAAAPDGRWPRCSCSVGPAWTGAAAPDPCAGGGGSGSREAGFEVRHSLGPQAGEVNPDVSRTSDFSGARPSGETRERSTSLVQDAVISFRKKIRLGGSISANQGTESSASRAPWRTIEVTRLRPDPAGRTRARSTLPCDSQSCARADARRRGCADRLLGQRVEGLLRPARDRWRAARRRRLPRRGGQLLAWLRRGGGFGRAGARRAALRGRAGAAVGQLRWLDRGARRRWAAARAVFLGARDRRDRRDRHRPARDRPPERGGFDLGLGFGHGCALRLGRHHPAGALPRWRAWAR